MQFTKEELHRLLRWFNTLDSVEPNFMEDVDLELVLKIASEAMPEAERATYATDIRRAFGRNTVT